MIFRIAATIISATVVCVCAEGTHCTPSVTYSKPAAAYQAPVAHQHQAVVVTPVPIIAVPVAPYYYSVGDEIRDRALADSIVQQLRATNANPLASAGGPLASTASLDFRLMGASSAGGQSRSGGELDGAVLGIFRNSCARCHKSGANSPGGIQLLSGAGGMIALSDPSQERDRRRRIYESVASGSMPKNGQPIEEQQKQLLQAWAEQ
jgi:hypothetical protein